MTTPRRLCIVTVFSIYIVFASAQAVLAEWQPRFDVPVAIGTVKPDSLDELSGVAVSRRNPGVLWVHNDKGGDPRVYALDWTGRLLGKYEMEGASDRDYEDIAIGPGPEPGVHYVYVGNIGDNDEKYDSVFIYRFPEPAVSLDQTGKKYIVSGVEQIELVYPFGPRDAEALMVDVNGDIYLVTKYRKPAELYVARYPQTLGQPNLLERLCYVYVEWRDSNSRTATGGDISANGGLITLRGRNAAFLWIRRAGQTVAEALSEPPVEMPLVWQEQGEAIAFTPDAMGCITLSEGENQPIYHAPRIAPVDVNADGVTDMADYAVLAEHWQQTDCCGCEGHGSERRRHGRFARHGHLRGALDGALNNSRPPV